MYYKSDIYFNSIYNLCKLKLYECYWFHNADLLTNMYS